LCSLGYPIMIQAMERGKCLIGELTLKFGKHKQQTICKWE
jgi:hypothetical protein